MGPGWWVVGGRVVLFCGPAYLPTRMLLLPTSTPVTPFSGDFEKWFADMSILPKDKHFAFFSFDRVFRYVYDPSLHDHGHVKVTYKDLLARKGSTVDAEWAPVEEMTTTFPKVFKDGFVEQKVNVTSKKGVRFVLKPPDLRCEPPREPLNVNKDWKPAESCRQILKHCSTDLSERDIAFWNGLQDFHLKFNHAEQALTYAHPFRDSVRDIAPIFAIAALLMHTCPSCRFQIFLSRWSSQRLKAVSFGTSSMEHRILYFQCSRSS
jgi:hypothetical protein